MRSISNRLVLVFNVGSALVLGCLGIYISYAVERHFEQSDFDKLSNQIAHIDQLISSTRNRQELFTAYSQIEQIFSIHTGTQFVIMNAQGKIEIASQPNGNSLLPSPQQIVSDHAYLVRSADSEFRVLSKSTTLNDDEHTRLTITTGVDIGHHRHFMRTLNQSLLFALGLSFVILGALGIVAVRRGLAPARKMAMTAQSISVEHLYNRIDLNQVPVELIELGRAFNEMLSRLEESFTRLSHFSVDIAHELRTPLSNLMMQTQVALNKTRNADEYREALYSNLEEYERLSRMIDDMLFIAKAENKLISLNRQQLNLRHEIDKLCEFFEAFADEHRVKLAVNGDATIKSDRIFMQRVLSNLIANAIQNSNRETTVTIKLTQNSNDDVEIIVSNFGETIAPEHLPRLFDRFYRIDPSRQRHQKGAGLGLAITRAIVEAHGGTVSAESKDGRTTFRAYFPKYYHA